MGRYGRGHWVRSDKDFGPLRSCGAKRNNPPRRAVSRTIAPAIRTCSRRCSQSYRSLQPWMQSQRPVPQRLTLKRNARVRTEPVVVLLSSSIASSWRVFAKNPAGAHNVRSRHAGYRCLRSRSAGNANAATFDVGRVVIRLGHVGRACRNWSNAPRARIWRIHPWRFVNSTRHRYGH